MYLRFQIFYDFEYRAVKLQGGYIITTNDENTPQMMFDVFIPI